MRRSPGLTSKRPPRRARTSTPANPIRIPSTVLGVGRSMPVSMETNRMKSGVVALITPTLEAEVRDIPAMKLIMNRNMPQKDNPTMNGISCRRMPHESPDRRAVRKRSRAAAGMRMPLNIKARNDSGASPRAFLVITTLSPQKKQVITIAMSARQERLRKRIIRRESERSISARIEIRDCETRHNRTISRGPAPQYNLDSPNKTVIFALISGNGNRKTSVRALKNTPVPRIAPNDALTPPHG
jgi:hypothetical protein